MTWRVGVDVGGTFTDLFAWNEQTSEYRTAKVLTTKDDRSRAVISAVEKAGLPFVQINYLMHGTTTATNSLIERTFPDAAFITTEGFRDTLGIGRQHRKLLYDKPQPLIKRRNRFVLPERVSVKGEIRRPLDDSVARAVVKTIAQRGIRAVGIGLINSYANPAHEERMRAILLEESPDAFVAISAETRPIFREHGRFVTTAIRTCMMPVMTSYFDRLEESLRDKGFRGALLILKSNGGVMGAANAKSRPEELIESGPAGGVAYAAYLARTTNVQNIIHTDVGGTSFDASIVEGGVGLITRSYELEWEMPVSVPMLDIHSVGAGGGSIGWVDSGDSLRVGPQSAGAEPGPACYSGGGTQPTITDANLILGRLHPSLSDKFELDTKAAERAIDALAKRVGLSRLETAEGMIRISCEKMAQAVKGVVVARARDPRDFTLASFGGAGPMHACFVARAMNIPKVIIPAQAGVASALGATAMNLRHDLEAFMYASIEEADLGVLNRILGDLEKNARQRLTDDGVSAERMVLRRTAQMRYIGQTYEVDTALPEGTIGKSHLPEIAKAFHAAHELEYGVSSNDFPIAFVAVGVAAVGELKQPPVFNFAGDKPTPQTSLRPVYFDGRWIDTTVYDGRDLAPTFELAGPAIVEYQDSIAIIPPRCSGAVDTCGNLVVTIN
jgi:N-methylhydantoinase A